MDLESAARAFVVATRQRASDARTPAPERATIANIVAMYDNLVAGNNDVMALVGAIAMAATKQIAALERRIAELEARPTALKYCGPYDESRQYDPGEVVTRAGSAWHCNERTTLPPGDGARSWTLMVKRGRDGGIDEQI